jgi:hypothetical protein
MGEKTTYWSDGHVKAGNWIILPNTRVAKLHHLCGERKVFITNDRKLVCEHGEVSSSICSWMSTERRADAAGTKPSPRNSVCDCANTDGLHWTKEMPKPLTDIIPPANTLFGVLNELGTSKVIVRGHALRHVPHTNGSAALFVSEKGGLLCCRHGNSLNVLRAMHAGKMKKFRGGICNCCVKKPPRRVGLMTPMQSKALATAIVA